MTIAGASRTGRLRSRPVRRGDIWMMDFSYPTGSEGRSMSAPKRTTLGRGVVTVVPVTGNVHRIYPFQIRLAARTLRLPATRRPRNTRLSNVSLLASDACSPRIMPTLTPAPRPLSARPGPSAHSKILQIFRDGRSPGRVVRVWGRDVVTGRTDRKSAEVRAGSRRSAIPAKRPWMACPARNEAGAQRNGEPTLALVEAA